MLNAILAALAVYGALTLPGKACLRSDLINLRTSPGLSAPFVAAVVAPGDPVVLLGVQAHWRLVRLHDGLSGWVHKSMIGACPASRTSASTLVSESGGGAVSVGGIQRRR